MSTPFQFLPNRGALNEAEISQSTRLPSQPAPASGRHANRTLWEISPQLAELVPESVARENLVVPVALKGERLTVAAVNPDDIALADRLRFILAKDVRLV